MEYEVTELSQVDFGATGVNEILQNVRTIISTPKYSVPLNREFGVDTTMLDAPIPVAQAKLTAQIVAAVHKWEPRATVTRVTYEGEAQDGILRPKVRVRISE